MRSRGPEMRLGTGAGAVLCLLWVLASPVHADLVYLLNGRVLRGEVLREDATYVVLRVPYGEVKLRVDQVDYIVRQTKLEYRIDTGREYLGQKRFAPALKQFEEALQENKDSVEARQALGEAYSTYTQHLQGVQRLGEARRYCLRLLQLQPESKTGQATLAKLNQGRVELEAKIARARAALAGQDLDGALTTFQEILATDSDAREELAAEIGQAWMGKGLQFYQARDFEKATEALEQAFGFDSKLAEQMEELYTACALNQAIAKLNEGHSEEAGKALERILTFAPTNPHALYVAGRFAQSQQRVQEAIACYAAGLQAEEPRASPEAMARLRAELEKRLEIPEGGGRLQFPTEALGQGQYEKSKPGEFERFETEHFVIHHHNDKLGGEVGRVLEAHRSRILALTGFRTAWREKAAVYLHRTQEVYTKLTGQGAWTGGMSRFRHGLGAGLNEMQIHTWQTSPRLFKSVLPHEVTHLIVNNELQAYEQLPRSLQEGFAVLMEPQFRQSYFLDFLRTRMRSKEFIGIEDLLGMKDYPSDPDFFYAEGFALLSFLVQGRGLPEVLKLITETDKIETRLPRIANLKNLQQVEERWKAWLERPPK